MSELPLGKHVSYTDSYDASLLFQIARQQSRDTLGIAASHLPFYGVDIWNAYELSWLNSKGKPVVAWAEFFFPCDSEFIVESKSFKLYLNSLNQSIFESYEHLQGVLTTDLSACVNAKVDVNIHAIKSINDGDSVLSLASLEGQCLDDLDVSVESYSPNPNLLQVDKSSPILERQVYSHLLRSLCPVTGQPDWGSVHISYHGPCIEVVGLLEYLIGYRQHQEFHEQCVERIFNDIMQRCSPQQLTVYARYLRRGGLDINPFRSTHSQFEVSNSRLVRQ